MSLPFGGGEWTQEVKKKKENENFTSRSQGEIYWERDQFFSRALNEIRTELSNLTSENSTLTAIHFGKRNCNDFTAGRQAGFVLSLALWLENENRRNLYRRAKWAAPRKADWTEAEKTNIIKHIHPRTHTRSQGKRGSRTTVVKDCSGCAVAANLSIPAFWGLSVLLAFVSRATLKANSTRFEKLSLCSPKKSVRSSEVMRKGEKTGQPMYNSFVLAPIHTAASFSFEIHSYYTYTHTIYKIIVFWLLVTFAETTI